MMRIAIALVLLAASSSEAFNSFRFACNSARKRCQGACLRRCAIAAVHRTSTCRSDANSAGESLRQQLKHAFFKMLPKFPPVYHELTTAVGTDHVDVAGKGISVCEQDMNRASEKDEMCNEIVYIYTKYRASGEDRFTKRSLYCPPGRKACDDSPEALLRRQLAIHQLKSDPRYK